MKCDEIFAALAMLEKERGISQDFMMDKIVQALTTAYKKDHPELEDVRVDEQQKIWKVVLYVDDGLVGGKKTVYVWEWGVAVLMVEEPMD